MHGSTDKESAAHGSAWERDAYDVPDVAFKIGVDESYVWKLVASGELPSFKLGRLRKIAKQDLADFIDRLRDEERKLRAGVSA